MYTMAIIPSTVGFHWEEVFDPYYVLKEAGWHPDFYTVDGRPPLADPNSIKKHFLLSYLGLGVRDDFAPESHRGQVLTAALATAKNITDLNINQIDAIYLPGGHGCLFDVNTNDIVHKKILECFEHRKLIGAVCHGTSTLAFVKNISGNAIIKNRKVIGFLDSEDALLKAAGLINKKFLPLPFKNEQTLLDAGADITPIMRISALFYPPYHITDLPFVTGVGPKAAGEVAREIIHIIEEKKY